MHVWKLDLNQQKNRYEGILFLFSNSPPFYPYYMYFVTNRIELDLHRNWVSRIQIWWISQPYFCGPPLSIGIQKMEHHRGYDNNGRNTARSTRRIIGSWNNAAFRHILISNSTFFWLLMMDRESEQSWRVFFLSTFKNQIDSLLKNYGWSINPFTRKF